MAEIGLDISPEFPKPLTNDKVQTTDIVITMGCGDARPVYPGKRYLDWDLPDPAELSLDQVRPIRDEIERRARGLLDELDDRPRVTWVTPLGLFTASIWKLSSCASSLSQSRSPRPSTMGTTTMCG